jgi:hypothetical protein
MTPPILQPTGKFSKEKDAVIRTRENMGHFLGNQVERARKIRHPAAPEH